MTINSEALDTNVELSTMVISAHEEIDETAARTVATLDNEPVQSVQVGEPHRLQQSVDWAKDLTPQQQRRLWKAQAQSAVLEQDWTLPTWADLAANKIAELQKQDQDDAKPSRVYVANAAGKTPASLPRASVVANQTSANRPPPAPEPTKNKGAFGQTVSMYSTPEHPILPADPPIMTVNGLNLSVHTGKDGSYQYPDISENSVIELKSQSPQHITTEQIAVVGDKITSYVFPEKMLSAFLDIISEQMNEKSITEGGTVVWGRIVNDRGMPVSGLRVQVDSDPDRKPIYFNSLMIPDAKLQTTGDNGLFAFVNLSEGLQLFTALNKDSRYVSHGNTMVTPGSVSTLEIQQSSYSSAVLISVFDAFTSQPASARLSLQSLENPVVVNGEQEVMLPVVNRYSLLDAETTPGYEPALYPYIDKNTEIYVPLIQTDWLRALRGQARIDDQVDSGTIIGFVPNNDYDAFLAGVENYPAHNVVYFDSHGDISRSGGVAGGGFILFNVPNGARNVVVIPKDGHDISTILAPADAHKTTVIHFSTH
jgi:hypothetical protein